MKFFMILLVVIPLLVVSCGKDDLVDSNNSNNPAGRLYVPNQADQSLSIYNSQNYELVKTFPTPIIEPHFVEFDHQYNYYYIIGRQVGGQIAKYRTSDDSLMALVTVEGAVFPTALSLSLNDDTLYLTDFTLGAGHTHRYNSSGNQLIWIDSSLQAGYQTHDIKTSPDGKYVVSAGFSSDDITIIDIENGDLLPFRLEDGQNFFNQVSNNYGGYGVAFDASGERLFIACSKGADQIRVIDMVNKVILDSIMVPVSNSGNPARNGPTYMAVTPDNQLLFVTNYLDNSVVAINLNSYSITGTFELGTPKPFGISMANNGSRLYVSCTNTRPDSGMVYVINPEDLVIVDSISVGSEPFGLVYAPII